MLGKLKYWIRKHGVVNLVKLFFEHLRRRFMEPGEVLFYADASELEDREYRHAEGLTMERHENKSDIPREDLEALYAEKGGEEAFAPFLDKFFRRGAVFYIVKLDGKVAGYQWSAVGWPEGFYRVPLVPTDAVLHASETFPAFRGKGINPWLTDRILFSLRDHGATRVYAAVRAWNKVNIRSLPKTNLKIIGTSLESRLFGYRVCSWKASQFEKK